MKGIRKPDPVLNFSSRPGALIVTVVQKAYHSQEFLVVSGPWPNREARDMPRASPHVGQLGG